MKILLLLLVLGLAQAQVVVVNTPTCIDMKTMDTCVNGTVVNCAWCPMSDLCAIYNPCKDDYSSSETKSLNCSFAIMSRKTMSCQQLKYNTYAIIAIVLIVAMVGITIYFLKLPRGEVVSIVCGLCCCLTCLILIATYIIFLVARHQADQSLIKTATEILSWSMVGTVTGSLVLIAAIFALISLVSYLTKGRVRDEMKSLI